ncbi:MAG: helix-turn-helix transcriptional regulator [Candidatus Omnitrophica bacterium]|nr:helix-turn-helix transcriptional regulator [Candidatus Omnitrophota bacterium]
MYIAFEPSLNYFSKQIVVTHPSFLLAQLSEVDYKYIQRLESNAPSSPSLNIIEKLVKAFNITASQLLKF